MSPGECSQGAENNDMLFVLLHFVIISGASSSKFLPLGVYHSDGVEKVLIYKARGQRMRVRARHLHFVSLCTLVLLICNLIFGYPYFSSYFIINDW